MTPTHDITRREAIGIGLGLMGAALTGCGDYTPPTTPDPLDQLRLTAVPGTPTKTVSPGLQSLDVGARQALLFVPQGYNPNTPAPFALTLHGAGGTAQEPIDLLQSHADTAGLLLLSCKSLQPTWGGIFGDYADDIPLFDQALKLAFDMCNVDPTRVGIEGFSDGASYAIQIGRANGDLFKRVVSFSAGLLLFTTGVQRPRFFVAHGDQDTVINVNTGRNIAQQLSTAYTVTYREFSGGHTVPPDVAADGVSFLTSAT